MPLRLVIGPANSSKAAVVLDGVRAAIDHDPLLVVPTAQDVDRYRRELSDGGAVFGPRVLRFDGLVDELARRAGLRARPLGETARRRLVARVVSSTPLEALRASAATPGFAAAAARLFAELEAAHVDPRRLAEGLRSWAGGEAGRRAYGGELARLYGTYRAALDRLGRPDAELHAVAALDAIRLRPSAWGDTPVFLYGFDDLTALERDAVETLARVVGAEVTVSLSFERGRTAFAGRAATFAELEPLADDVLELPAQAEHYAPASRAALHGLERRLFEPAGPGAEPLDPGDAVALVEAGGERAELELVAAEVRRLLAAGVPADEIAVLVRSPEEQGPLVERVFADYAIPLALRRRVPFAHTAPGRALLGLLRATLLDGTAEDLLAWLRAPRGHGRPHAADRLEARVRREGLGSAAAALDAWTDGGYDPPAALGRLRAAAGAGPAALCATLSAELVRLATPAGGAPRPEDPPAPDRPDERAAARAVAAGRRALEELAELAAEDPRLGPTAAELAVELGAVEVLVGEPPGAGRVTVCDPLALRARRVRALVVCGMQEGQFPRPARPDPFLGDDERRSLAGASGIRLPVEDDGGLGAERYLLYAAVSRPEERLVLSFRTADDDGDPAVPSLFVDDVRDLFSADLWERRERRPLGAVGWPQGAPTARAAARERAVAEGPVAAAPLPPLRSPAAIGALRAQPVWSATALEKWARCPVSWFVERHLEAKPLEPDAEPLVRGGAGHEVLELTFRDLRERTGSARLTPERLEEARAALRETLTEVVARHRLSVDETRMRAGVRRLEADLMRYLDFAAREGSTWEPWRFEVTYGFEDEPDSLPALEIPTADGEPVRLRGRLDRVDVDPAGGRASVVDYKGSSVTGAERWVRNSTFQAALYLRVVRDLLGLDPAGAFYQPLRGRTLRRRGLMLADADPDLPLTNGDRTERERFEEILDEVVAAAGRAAAEARAGALEPRPETCTPAARCAHPTLCRCEQA